MELRAQRQWSMSLGARRNSRPSLSLLLAALHLLSLQLYQVLGGGPRLAARWPATTRNGSGGLCAGGKSVPKAMLLTRNVLGCRGALVDIAASLRGCSNSKARYRTLKGSPSTTAVRPYLSGTSSLARDTCCPQGAATSLPREGAKHDHARRHDLTKESRAALGALRLHPGREDPEPVLPEIPPVATRETGSGDVERLPLHEGRFGIEQVAVGEKIVYNRSYYWCFYPTRFCYSK